MDPFDLNGMEDSLPEETKKRLKILKENMLLEKASQEALIVATTTLKFAADHDLKKAFSFANILLMVSGLVNNHKDLEEFENIVTDFAAKKLGEVLQKGGENSDTLLDKIGEDFDGDMKDKLFKMLGGKMTTEELKIEVKKESEEKDGDKSTED